MYRQWIDFIATMPLTSALTVLMFLLFQFFGAIPEQLIFDRHAILQQHEVWRLFTAHWVHSDLQHLLWNVAGFFILGGLIEPHISKYHFIAIIIFSSLAVDLCVLYLIEHLQYYCGLSGVLNTLLVVLFHLIWQKSRSPWLILGISLAALKIMLEILLQQAIFTQTLWQALPEAHAAGFLAGILSIQIKKQGSFLAMILTQIWVRIGILTPSDKKYE
jgi:rhomboid family GlyGly-CTERM serine protease